MIVTRRQSAEKPYSSVCTGIHVGSGLVLTAGHCVYSRSKTPAVTYTDFRVLIGCERADERRSDRCIERSAKVYGTELDALRTDVIEGWDVVFLRVSDYPGNFEGYYLPLDGSSLQVDDPLSAAVWFNPRGEEYTGRRGKVLMHDEECRVTEFQGTGSTRRIVHRCDTQRGSSGSPILLRSGGVVGVHLSGLSKKIAGEELVKDGLVVGTKNYAMPVSTVKEYLVMKEAFAIIEKLTWVN